MSDFDTMMAKKKEERSHSRRKRRNIDIINDNDDLIVDMLKRMREAADVSINSIRLLECEFKVDSRLIDSRVTFLQEDRNLNQNHQPATRKLIMLPSAMRQLNK